MPGDVEKEMYERILHMVKVQLKTLAQAEIIEVKIWG